MGVSGLTTYIARNAQHYLKPYELHDCNLAIDGDCLACRIYTDVTGICSAFGGDYDDFYRAVVEFFLVLAECNIKAYVILDGGYEQRKLRTVNKRLRGKIALVKRINPNASPTLFPLHIKEVFIDAVKDCNVPIMRCVFEADDELAALGRKLNCPVLSYDSDFYIHDVAYIPLITLTAKVKQKIVKEKNNKTDTERVLAKNQVTKISKRTRTQRILTGIQRVSAGEDASKCIKEGRKSYKYLDCCIYRMEYFCQRHKLSKDKMPLFAAMLGNDYISPYMFRNFFAVGMCKIGNSRKSSSQKAKRITRILEWLKNETVETALEKILSRLKKTQKAMLVTQIDAATSGYLNELCHAYEYFLQEYNFNHFNICNVENEQKLENESDTFNEEIKIEEEVEENKENCKAECGSEDEEVASTLGSEDSEEPTDEAEASNDECDDDAYAEDLDKTVQFPNWFLAKLYSCQLPRYFVDLLHLRKYINTPLIEHFLYDDCNELALPILVYVYTLLHNVEGEETQPALDDAGSALPIEFTYLTRNVRVTNIHYVRCAIKEQPKYPFVVEAPDARHLRSVFEHKMRHLNVDLLFEKITELPKDLQLYFLAIVFWLQKSQHCDLLHLHSLIVCLVVLRTIDATIPAERQLKAFEQRFGKIIKKERKKREDDIFDGKLPSIKPALLELSIPERMKHVPKSDCYLVQQLLLPHFHMQSIFKRKYDAYSTVVLHSFAEFQSVLFQLRGLNALLNEPYESPRMGQLYCGVLLYNLYDLLRKRLDTKYYVENFIFADSRLMFDFYCYLVDWCAPFVPAWKHDSKAEKKKLQKKRKNAHKKSAADKSSHDPYADMLEQDTDDNSEYNDLNNKFSSLKV